MESKRSAKRGRRRAVARMLALGLGAGLAAGCGGDDGGGGGMQTIPCVQLMGAAVPAPDTVVAEDAISGSCNLLEVDLTVTDVDELFGANMLIGFPSNLIAFSSASPVGSVLTSGSAVSVQAGVPQEGVLSVGISRLNTTGVNVVGGQLLLKLTFVRLASQGSGGLVFTTGELLDPSTPPQPIAGIQFHGATVAVVQVPP